MLYFRVYVDLRTTFVTKIPCMVRVSFWVEAINAYKYWLLVLFFVGLLCLTFYIANNPVRKDHDYCKLCKRELSRARMRVRTWVYKTRIRQRKKFLNVWSHCADKQLCSRSFAWSVVQCIMCTVTLGHDKKKRRWVSFAPNDKDQENLARGLTLFLCLSSTVWFEGDRIGRNPSQPGLCVVRDYLDVMRRTG